MVDEGLGFRVGTYNLHPDANFNFQLNRMVMYADGDLEEVREAAKKVSDMASWVSTFKSLGEKALGEGRVAQAISYFRGAEFFMYGDLEEKHRLYDRVTSLFYEHYSRFFEEGTIRTDRVPYEGKYLPLWITGPGEGAEVILLHGGYDSCKEEFLRTVFYLGERGYNVYRRLETPQRRHPSAGHVDQGGEMKGEGGYAGSIPRVDLSSGEIDIQPTAGYADAWMGGRGIAARIYWEEVPPEVGAFDPQNRLVFITGPLAGVAGVAGSRWQVCGKSPAPNTGGVLLLQSRGEVGGETQARGVRRHRHQGRVGEAHVSPGGGGTAELRDASPSPGEGRGRYEGNAQG